LFGIPCVLTNWWPAGQRPFNARDIYIPKLVQLDSPPRVLGFAQMMAPPVGYAPNYIHGNRLKLGLVPNSAEELREVVREMLDRLDGHLSYSAADEALQSAFDAVARTNESMGNARLGCSFLRHHIDLLIHRVNDAS
jgi:putative glycosyltransferase (TIGR04372 family)